MNTVCIQRHKDEYVIFYTFPSFLVQMKKIKTNTDCMSFCSNPDYGIN